MEELDALLQASWVDKLCRQFAGVHQIEEVAEDVGLNVSRLQADTVTGWEDKETKIQRQKNIFVPWKCLNTCLLEKSKF